MAMALSPPVPSSVSLPSRTARLPCPSRLLRLAPRAYRLPRLDGVLEGGKGLLEAVEELERMSRDPSDVLCAMVDRLSVRELQLVLVYFAQEGRDSYCALEVFDWLRRENRVDGETRELMVSIACSWIERLVEGGNQVGDVIGLLGEIECVGLDPGFSLEEKVVSLYWDKGKREEAIEFVRDVMSRGAPIGGAHFSRVREDERGGPLGYLAWKMMVDGKYMEAVKLVMEFRECGLSPEAYSYLIALTALVKEQKDFSKKLRSLRIFIKDRLVSELDKESSGLIQKHQADILEKGALLSGWAFEQGSSAISGLVHERLLALYTCAGHGLAAEQQLWKMKLAGKTPDKELYNMVLAICASQNEERSIRRLLAGLFPASAGSKRAALLWVLRGYVKGGHFSKASDTLEAMLDLGLYPDYLDRAAVLHGLGKRIKEPGILESYLRLCKRLADADLIGPCLLYFHIIRHNMWVIKAL